MKRFVGIVLIPVLATLVPLSASLAQAPVYSYGQAAPDRPAFSQAGLDQMLAPIALYPDALLAQILMASTYPADVVQAARFSRAYPQLRGDDAVRAVETYGWDPSVNSLMAFPQLLAMMNERLDWTEQLGEAFLDQQSRVMASVQGLRQRAWMAGNLQSNEQVSVVREGPAWLLEQPYPQVAYVPYYDPLLIYGGWWWPARPPIRWAPWTGYMPRPGSSTGFFQGAGVSLPPGILFGRFDWPHRRIQVVDNINNNDYNSNNAAIANRAIIDGRRGNDTPAARTTAPAYWQHDPAHRGGVPYPDRATRHRGGEGGAPAVVRTGVVAQESSAFNRQSGAAAPGLQAARPATRFDARADRDASPHPFAAAAEPRRQSRPTPVADSVPRPPAAPATVPPAEPARDVRRDARRDAQREGGFAHAGRVPAETAGMPARGAVMAPEQRPGIAQAARAMPSHDPRIVAASIDHAAPAGAARAMPPADPVRPVADVRAPPAALGERPSGLHGHERRDSPAVAQRVPEAARATTPAPANPRASDPAARPAGQARADAARVRREG